MIPSAAPSTSNYVRDTIRCRPRLTRGLSTAFGWRLTSLKTTDFSMTDFLKSDTS
jgi:hypothetical protein